MNQPADDSGGVGRDDMLHLCTWIAPWALLNCVRT
jgi:hypothetical protein